MTNFEQIGQVLARYSRAADHRDGFATASLFQQDGHLEVGHRNGETLEPIRQIIGQETMRPALSVQTRVASISDHRRGVLSVFARINATALSHVAKMADAGILKVAVAQSYPLAQAADAQRPLTRPGRSSGKTVLVP